MPCVRSSLPSSLLTTHPTLTTPLVLAQCDCHIAQVGRDLERILALAEDDVAGARFAAASALVQVVLEQKVYNSNERVQLQDELLQRRQRQDPSAKTLCLDETSSEAPLSSHAKFLRDMLEQVRSAPTAYIASVPLLNERVASLTSRAV